MCPRCDDSGLVHTRDSKGYERVYRCYCPLGEKYAETLFAPSDKEKAHPMGIPKFQERVLSPRDKRAGNDD